jgi:hypothetical protein
VPVPALAVLGVVLALLVLIPTRRLYLAGWRGLPLWGYFAVLVCFGLLVAELRAPARFLVPLLVIAYLAPFVTGRAGFDRLLGRGDGGGQFGRGGSGSPPRDVTPRDGTGRDGSGRDVSGRDVSERDAAPPDETSGPG